MTKSLGGVHPVQKKCAYCLVTKGVKEIKHGPGYICLACSIQLQIETKKPFTYSAMKEG